MKEKKAFSLFNHSSDYAILNQLILQLVDISHLVTYGMISYPTVNLLSFNAWRIIVKLHFQNSERSLCMRDL